MYIFDAVVQRLRSVLIFRILVKARREKWYPGLVYSLKKIIYEEDLSNQPPNYKRVTQDPGTAFAQKLPEHDSAERLSC